MNGPASSPAALAVSSFIARQSTWLLCVFIATICLWPDGDYAALHLQRALAVALGVAALAALVDGTRPGLAFIGCVSVYAAAVSVSALLASGTDSAWRGFVEAWWLACVASATSIIARRGRASSAALGALIASVAIALLGAFGPRSMPDGFGRYLRYAAFSHWGAYPEIGLLAILGAAAAVALALSTHRPRLAAAAAVLALYFGVIPLYVGSRSAYSALAAAVGWLCVTAVAKWRSRIVLALSIGVVLAGVAGAAMRWTSVERAARQTMSADALSERAVHWRAAWGMVGDHPLFGVGPGGFQAAYPRYQAGNALPNAHNMVLHVAAETGLTAAVPFLALWALVLWQSWRRSDLTPEGCVAFAIHGLLIAFFIRGVTDQFLSGVHSSLRTSLLLGVLLGLGEACGGFYRRPDPRSV